MSRGEAGRTRTRLRVTLKPAPVWAFLEERDISQNELARLVGISSGYPSQLMSGSAHPSPELRQRLLRVLGVTDFDNLFTPSVSKSASRRRSAARGDHEKPAVIDGRGGHRRNGNAPRLPV